MTRLSVSSRNVVKPSFFLNNFDFRGGKTAHFCVNQCKSLVLAGMTLQNSNKWWIYSTLQYFTVCCLHFLPRMRLQLVTTKQQDWMLFDILWQSYLGNGKSPCCIMLHSENSQSIGRRATFCHVFSKIGILALRLREQSACFAELA